MNSETEIWKVIEDFPDYEVSNLGRIKSFKQDKINGKILKPQSGSCGYKQINLYLNKKICSTKYIHLLVLKTFNNINENLFCNHKDGNKTNYQLKNLEWCTQSENEKHAYRTGLKKPVINSKLKDGEVWLIKKILDSDYYKSGKITQNFIGKMFDISFQTVSLIKLGKTWSHIKLENVE